ncbi:MAG: Rossman fold protein, TIGR00730 family [Candidatus Dactylopiibacterium carminicum]|uniref:Cytokinin riboside 5'-monophosphate phosphoribohydrolase n=1 Tax=Candidatus Dactylopiibacterium carminicum TaxID=857335 RepID=A0A272ESS8_9RHOO|nr:TIGR00730 family Rossman fold protein [Candidatus Dactylopiibacterium carminicum]KAF7598864.1 TIGR00730 family Rossman fold protein [Candidatus Dactylopiibacterium carminicum]PAS92780.1 MAG: Rossman fold protein, TIGR00730 family [Candidatus Dactylopiibacterium carminicum]PAS96229.1 MAG: Rossman fold protein, TIGR00730 family [Candidatus Dactylopiibacterium carminicum]PAS98881.1 MAG: Rossman fold protein, TIGR00730 family [Candidatus Dactylopiibacterium carminicum]
MKLRSIAVYCGSNFGASPVYAEGARALGSTLAGLGITLVYGGTHKGLMGVVADAVLAAGGQAHGVISQRLFDRGHLHPQLTRHEITPDMRSRKARMAELADGFIALPGGMGTLEELFEVATLAQLGDLVKPSAVLNINGFYDPMRAMLENMAREEFMRIEHADMILLDADPKRLIERMESWQRPTVEKWFPTKSAA